LRAAAGYALYACCMRAYPLWMGRPGRTIAYPPEEHPVISVGFKPPTLVGDGGTVTSHFRSNKLKRAILATIR